MLERGVTICPHPCRAVYPASPSCNLFRLGDIAPAGGVAGTAEIVLDAVLEDTCHVSSYFHFQTFKLKMKSDKFSFYI